jgi:CHAP domain
VSGRHTKPTFHQVHAAELKTVGGVVAGAAIAGAIAASAAFTTPHTKPTSDLNTGARVASQRALADIAVLRTGDRPMSRHEVHSRHQVHANHKTRAVVRPAGAGKSRSGPAKPSKPSKASKVSRSAKRRPGGVKSVSAQQVIKLAKSQVGISEDRSGTTKFNKWYMDDSRAQRTIKRDGGSRGAYRDAAWCDMFVSWIGNKLGLSGTVGFDAWAVKHAEWFKDHGRWGHQPRPGAVTFFAWNGHKIDDIEHVGFTIKDNHDGTIQTVEGNTHNTVAIRERKKSFVVGYGYPDYKK